MSYKAVEEISRSSSEDLNIFILQGGAECLKTCISNITQLKDVAPELSSNTHGTTQIRIMDLKSVLPFQIITPFMPVLVLITLVISSVHGKHFARGTWKQA